MFQRFVQEFSGKMKTCNTWDRASNFPGLAIPSTRIQSHHVGCSGSWGKERCWNHRSKTYFNPEKIWNLGGGFRCFSFSPLFGTDSHFDYIIFFKGGWNHKLEMGENEVHPGRLTWNLRIHPWKRAIIWTNPSFSGSMLIYGGVGETNLPQIPYDVAPEKWQMIQLEDVLSPKSFSNGTPFQWQHLKLWGCRHIYLLRALENSIWHMWIVSFFFDVFFNNLPSINFILPTKKNASRHNKPRAIRLCAVYYWPKNPRWRRVFHSQWKWWVPFLLLGVQKGKMDENGTNNPSAPLKGAKKSGPNTNPHRDFFSVYSMGCITGTGDRV